MRKAERARFDDGLYNVVLRVSGSVKNELLSAAEAHSMSLSNFVLFCCWVQVRADRGIPFPGSAQFTIPDGAVQLRAYLTGERLLQPCGREVCDMSVVEVAGMEFCDTCNVRIR